MLVNLAMDVDPPKVMVWRGDEHLERAAEPAGLGPGWQHLAATTATAPAPSLRPPAFQGVSAPFEGGQVVRFHPLDLYVMGFIPAGEVGNVAVVHGGHRRPVYQPLAASFSATVGPFMGTRNSGISLRTAPAACPT